MVQRINEQLTRFVARASWTYRIAGEAKRGLRQVEHRPLGLSQQERALRREENLTEPREQGRSPPERLVSEEQQASAVVVFQA